MSNYHQKDDNYFCQTDTKRCLKLWYLNGIDVVRTIGTDY